MRHPFHDAQTNVWADLYLKPVSGWHWETLLNTNTSAAFWMNSSGHLVAYSNTTPFVFSNVTVDADTWVRFLVHAAYSTKTWSLWMDGTNVLRDFDFYSPSASSFRELLVAAGKHSGETSCVDDVWIGLDEPLGELGEDLDRDGIPDWWEEQYFGSYSGAVHHVDSDGDGADNRDEYTADTSPTNEESLLRMVDIQAQSGGVHVAWQGGTAAVQYLECRTDLSPGAEQWLAIFTNQPPTPVTGNVLHTGATNRAAFYRIRATR